MIIKRILLILLFTLSIFFTGCNSDDSMSGNMPEGKLISITIPANYHSSYNYVNYFVNSLDGKLIYSEKINNDEEVLFEVDQDENNDFNRYDFSRCSIKDYTTYKNIVITTYIGIKPFSLEFKTSSSTLLGNAYVKFTSVPAYNSFLIAAVYSNLTSGNLSSSTFTIPLYSDQPTGLFIRLETNTGDLYKFVEGLTVGQTTTVSLSNMSSDFETANILLNDENFSYYSLMIDRYSENDFSSGSYSIFSSSVSVPISFSYPITFMSNSYIRTYLYGSANNKYSDNVIYSDIIPDHIDLLDGDLTINAKFPESISYDIDLNDKIDILYLTWSHPTSFRDANGFRVTWNIWVSPSVRDVQLPEIPDEILNYLKDTYGITDLQLDKLEPIYASMYQNGRAGNFDEWMKRYWLGWESPKLDEVDKYMNITLTTKKNDSESGKSVMFPEMYNSENSY